MPNPVKIEYGSTVLIDLTSDTIDSDSLLCDYTAFNNHGSFVSGNVPITLEQYITGNFSKFHMSSLLSCASGTFAYCSNLTDVSLPAVTDIGSCAFYSCTSLTSLDFPAVTRIGTSAFAYCSQLSEIRLNAPQVVTVYSSNMFSNTGITTTTGSIYVPANLLESYKTTPYWAYFSNRFFAI